MTEKNPAVDENGTMAENVKEEVKEEVKDEAKEKAEKKTEKKAEETKQGFWARIKSLFGK